MKNHYNVTLDLTDAQCEAIAAAVTKGKVFRPMVSGTVITPKDGNVTHGYLMLDAARLLSEAQRAQTENKPFVCVCISNNGAPTIGTPERQRDLATETYYTEGQLTISRKPS